MKGKQIIIRFTALMISILMLPSCAALPFLPQKKDSNINSHYGSLSVKDEWLYNGILQKNLEQMTEALKAGANVNEVHGKTGPKGGPVFETFPAYIAGISADSAAVKLLLDNGADVNHEGLGGQTFLMTKALENNISLCDYLISHGAKLEKTDWLGHTALDYLVTTDEDENSTIQTFKFLVSKGAKISQKTVELSLTNDIVNEHDSEYGYKYGLARLVLSEYLKSNKKSGLDPVLEAAMLGKSEDESRLINEGKLKNEYKNLITFYTAAFGSVDTMKLLQEKGQDIHLKDANNNTLLIIAAECGNLEMVKYFACSGLNLKATNSDSYNAMTLAEFNNHTDVTEYFLNSVADITFNDFKVPDVTEYSDVLNLAAQNNNIELIDNVLNKGFVLNEESLFNAVRSALGPIQNHYLRGKTVDVDKQLSTVEYLLEKGKAKKVSCDLTHILTYMPDIRAARCLYQHGADVNGETDKGTPLSVAIDNNNLEYVKFLISKGAKVNAPTLLSKSGEMDETLLNSAIMLGRFDIIKTMINSGANLELKNTREETPVCIAAARGSKNILAYLLEKGCKVNVQDINGETPLIIAVNNGWIQNVKLLLKYGADKSIANNKGKTAMDIAKSNNDDVMIALLK